MKRTEIKKFPMSDTTLANLEPEGRDYRVKDSDSGLYFVVKKSGTKSWQLRYKKADGVWSWYGLGAYPSISGHRARKLVGDIKSKLENGEELVTKKSIKQKAEEAENMKFKVLMSEWLDTKKFHWDDVTFDKAVKSIERHIIPVFGQRNFTSISPKEWFDFFQGLQRELGIYKQVEKLTSYARNAYDWAKFQEKIVFNPLEGITKHLDKNNGGNMKFVEINELPALIHAIRGYPKRDMAIGLELLIRLFPRPVELRFATWDQFDLEKAVWIKPAEIMKKGIAHAVPLSKQAVQLIKELETYRTESNLLFPSRESLIKPISDNTFNQALNRLGYKGRQNPHGFRHIASTELNNKYSDKEQVVEATLAHLKTGVKGVYDKGAHFEERIGMMQWWSDYVDEIVG
ncbi:integrase [Acinetobacter sp. ACNIH2]|uniref:tyrosine-type recombinase/integrase n=1 Tax=Acinetobacter sp. ACNIH2 TaxID=1758189 RepID=UPI000CDCD7BC|nr:tyrosine-type recombinase/integrase [Acinetobacter sp. ACNIH2]AUX86936.1 integrase [Acinetobacter sp. ACNIH2]